MSCVYISMMRSWRARLIMLSFRYESKISGKIVSMSKRIWAGELFSGNCFNFWFFARFMKSQSEFFDVFRDVCSAIWFTVISELSY